MNRCEISLGGERATLGIENGKIYADGYDLESEKMALILNSNLGEGIGALIVAIDEHGVKNYSNLETSLRNFAQYIEKVPREAINDLLLETNNALCYHYLSYSPNIVFRRQAASKNVFSPQAIKRLSKDPRWEVVTCVASNIKLNREQFLSLMNHPQELVRMSLVANYHLPIEYFQDLAFDPSASVRAHLAKSNRAGIETHKLLAFDSDQKVLANLYAEPEFSEDLQFQVCQKGNSRQRTILAELTSNEKIIALLLNDPDNTVARVARVRQSYFDLLWNIP